MSVEDVLGLSLYKKLVLNRWNAKSIDVKKKLYL